MPRPKGSKNKLKEAGNPMFNIKDAPILNDSDWQKTSAAVLPEDLAFEAELQRMDAVNELPPNVDPEPIGSIVVREKEKIELLSEAVEGIKVASTEQELRDQVYQAKVEGCDSIEATKILAKRFCRDPKLEEVGYFIFHDIKVYIEGSFDKVKKRDGLTIEQKIFGNAKY